MPEEFASLYLEARKREGRLYDDETLRRLPHVSHNDPHFHEWKLRASSARRLIRYLRRDPPRHLLDVGCGNGWLSNMLAEHLGKAISITAIDRNIMELEQARRVFGRPGLEFLHAEIFSESLSREYFDVILFAASIQYFSSLNDLIPRCMELLRKGGEIHCIDTNFYAQGSEAGAAERSRAYYARLGVADMSRFYFHHTRSEMLRFGARNLNGGPYIRLMQALHWCIPFPWYVIRK